MKRYTRQERNTFHTKRKHLRLSYHFSLSAFISRYFSNPSRDNVFALALHLGEQLLDKVEILIGKMAGNRNNRILRTVISVSYTHLDVYKRQVLMQYNEIAYCVFSEMRYNNIVIRKNRKNVSSTVRRRIKGGSLS